MATADRPRNRQQDGFTLVEVLVVLAILTLLALIVVPQVIGYLGKAKTDTARIEIENLSSALDLYLLDVGKYPSQVEGLKALVQQPAGAERWNGPYLRKPEAMNDPWQRPYIYRMPGEHNEFDLYSLGADNALGGEGEDQDVTNW
jgi:general secretion pathway protein G